MAAAPRARPTTAPAGDRCDRIGRPLFAAARRLEEVPVNVTRRLLATVAMLAVAAGAFAKPPDEPPPPGASAMPAMPKPGPEHAVLKDQAGVWDAMHRVMLDRLRAANRIDFSRVIVDSASVRAMHGGKKRAPAPWTAGKPGRNTTWRPTPAACR